jgi:hypothetical protein
VSTAVTCKWNGSGADGRGSDSSVSVTIADVTVNTTPNSSGGWNTASVTADLARHHSLKATDGVKPGLYHQVAPGIFRHQNG